MSDTLRERLRRGEQATASGLLIDTPSGVVLARVRRRRAARTAMVAVVSVAIIAAGAGIGSGFFGRANQPAVVVPTSPVTTPSESSSRRTNAELLEQARSEIVPASAAAADAAFNPVPGPPIALGTVATVGELGSDYVAACGAGPCERLSLPPVTPEVLGRLDDSWVVVVDNQYLGALGDPGLELTSLALASPEGDAYSLVDLGAWLDDAGLRGATLYGLALDSQGHRLMVELNSTDGPGQFLVWMDLDTGATSVVTRTSMDRISVAWTGAGWRVWSGNYPEQPVSVLLTPDAQSWSTDGLWAGTDMVVRPYDGAAIVEWPDAARFWYSDGNLWPADPGDDSWCSPIDVTSKRVLAYCFGETTAEPYTLDLGTGEWAQEQGMPSFPLDLGSVGASIGVAALGDGVLVNHDADNASRPGLTWWHGGVETPVEAPEGSTWPSAKEGSHGVWLTGPGGVGVVGTDGNYRSIIDGAALPQGGNRYVVPIEALAAP